MLFSTGRMVPETVAKGRFKILERLGSGCFGEVYRGVSVETGEEVAVKFEGLHIKLAEQQLEHEARVLQRLRKPPRSPGFAEFFHYGREAGCSCLVMERLGMTLDGSLEACGGHFSAVTVVLVAEQVLRCIEHLHARSVVHRDIKPENFMWGSGPKQHHLHLVDFGLSSIYFAKKHVPLTKRPLTGTVRYASINTHNRLEQSRRDDLEAIGYMLMYLLRGSLPWSGLSARTMDEKCDMIKRKKASIPLRELCQGHPTVFEDYLAYARGLRFAARPDYAMLRGQFRAARESLAQRVGHAIADHEFEWNDGRVLGMLAPLGPCLSPRQPDDRDGFLLGRSFAILCGGRRLAAEPGAVCTVASA